MSVERGIIYSLQTKLWSDEPSTLTVYREWRGKTATAGLFFCALLPISLGLLEACQSKQISATALNKQATVEPSEDE